MSEKNRTQRTFLHGSPTVGVIPGWQVHGGILDGFLPEVFRGIQAAARDNECNLMVAYGIGAPRRMTLGRPAWPVPGPNCDFVPVGPWNTDGLLVIPPLNILEGLKYFRDLLSGGFPVVFAGDNEPGPSAIVDNEGGIRQAFQHLVNHGHRQIAYIAGFPADLGHGDSLCRLQAFQKSLLAAGFEPDSGLIGYGYHSVLGGRQAIREILENKHPFTAVITSNDETAVGVLQGLRDAGLLVPQDVAVIGFDDRVDAKAQVPLLTTVRFPMYEMGYRALEMLLNNIRDGVGEPMVTQIPVRLVIRESCGCLPGVTTQTERGGEVRSHQSTQSYLKEWDNLLDVGEVRGKGKKNPLAFENDMAEAVFDEMHLLSKEEVTYLCKRIVETFNSSLTSRRPEIFRHTVQQILERVSSKGEDFYAWQLAITFLRNHFSELGIDESLQIDTRLAEDLLHEARMAISEIARGQATREILRQANLAEQVGQLTTYLFSATDEAELYRRLADYLPVFSIRQAAVAIYQPEGEDPYAWSRCDYPAAAQPGELRFLSRSFPPKSLFADTSPFHLVILPLVADGDVFGYVAFDTDEFDRCADIVRQLAAALKVMRLHHAAIEARELAEQRRQDAEEANRLKSRFLSMVSHELRTPLHLISGLSDILLREKDHTGQQELNVNRKDLERIYVGAQHLDGLIRDVLDLARSDIGQLKLMREPLVLKEVLNAVAVIGEQLASDKELSWRFDIPETLPNVWGDRTRLRQVALNLVANAVKFTASGEVALTAGVNDGFVVVSVNDTGLGIPPEEQDVIFDEFRQSERTTARGYGGLGLGLAICKRLVEMHGGQVGVQSSGIEGSGSRFYFTLPAMEKIEEYPCKDTLLAQAEKVVLLVNDYPGGVLLKSRLEKHGIEVDLLQVGKDDENWLSCVVNSRPDVVVLDLELASHRGWEILRIIKGNPTLLEIPVLFNKMPEGNNHGSLLEINYLAKPVDKVELAESLISHGLIDPGNGTGISRKILIVDDEPGIVELHARIVKNQLPDCEILKAYNGREALEKIRQENPSAVLLDLMMPEVDGFKVLQRMREEETSRIIPVIVLTSQSLTQDDMERLNFGVASILAKGVFSVDEIVTHLEDTLARKRRPGSDSQRIVMKAIAFIHSNYAEEISRNDVAIFVGLSERHLTRCFRQEIGITPITYLNRFRVKQAKVLLDAGERSITRVALDVGFSTGAYFTRVFQDEVGISPREYLHKSL